MFKEAKVKNQKVRRNTVIAFGYIKSITMLKKLKPIMSLTNDYLWFRVIVLLLCFKYKIQKTNNIYECLHKFKQVTIVIFVNVKEIIS